MILNTAIANEIPFQRLVSRVMVRIPMLFCTVMVARCSALISFALAHQLNGASMTLKT
jgi:hypothetical protein